MGKARSAAAARQARPRANPFEVKVNRQKFPVLGRSARHDVGQPGLSRARAIQKVRSGPPPGLSSRICTQKSHLARGGRSGTPPGRPSCRRC